MAKAASRTAPAAKAAPSKAKAAQPATKSAVKSAAAKPAGKAAAKPTPAPAPKKTVPAKRKAGKASAAPSADKENDHDEEEEKEADTEDKIALASDSDEDDESFEAEDDDGDEDEDDEEEELDGGGAEDDKDEESSDEDEEDAKANRDAPILEAGKLPSSKDDAAVKARLNKVKKEKAKSKSKEIPGVLYLGRLPHGFFEEQLRAYFSQFGTVTRVRLSRNRSTGAPKHYGFIEFADRDVATIVQETMDNYLLNGHLIQVKEVPKEKVHEKLWIGSGRKYRPIPRDRVQRLRHDAPKSKEQKAKVEENLLKREAKRRRKLKDAGIDYDFEGYKTAAK
ncbi:nucleolar protein [Tilletia horrida]|nr:nucleolar protein [Tilletia horrida]